MQNASHDTTTLWMIAMLWAVALGGGIWMFLRLRSRERLMRRMYADEQDKTRLDLEDPTAQGFLARWLYLAGYRQRGAKTSFVGATLACAAGGAFLVTFFYGSGIIEQAVFAAEQVPGGIGDLAIPVLQLSPWLVALILVMLPWSLVNSRRKERVRQVEQDLPVTLELLATMSESGLSFDNALTRVVEGHKENRPLFQELSTFQLEVLGGVSRVACFRRLARRIEVPSMTIFVSALVQAEQVGAGFASVLRSQADDMRGRRRENANMLAQALPVKLVFPLVICFLPGIFVSTLGPVFMQFIDLADGMTRR
ncbi:MAG: type II secretion system F family protein [Planctomycetia bacterium]